MALTFSLIAIVLLVVVIVLLLALWRGCGARLPTDRCARCCRAKTGASGCCARRWAAPGWRQAELAAGREDVAGPSGRWVIPRSPASADRRATERSARQSAGPRWTERLRPHAGRQRPALGADAADRRCNGSLLPLEQRLGESFRQVSERLEQVHQGLGEMRALAAGVDDLSRVLSNVKTRGTWGEMQLGTLLEQINDPGAVRGQRGLQAGVRERVEFRHPAARPARPGRR